VLPDDVQMKKDGSYEGIFSAKQLNACDSGICSCRE